MRYLPERKPMDRRTFLRGTMGAAGVAVGLPLLESMLDKKGRAWAAEGPDSEGPPTRYVVTFAGSAIGSSGEKGNDFIPEREGPIADQLPKALEPLGELGVADEVSVISGLEIPWADSDGQTPPPGGRVVQFHGGAQGPLLTGVRSQGDKTWDWIAGDSSDQIVADTFGVDAVVLRVQADLYRSGNNPGHTKKSISFRDGGSTPVTPLVDPHKVYDKLFGEGSGFQPPNADQQTIEERRQRLTNRRSVLDAVRSSYERLTKEGSLSRRDQMRLEQHFDEVRDLERRLEELAKEQELAGAACEMPDALDGGWSRTDEAWSHEDKRAEALTDMLYYAIVCDLTRVGTLQYTFRQCFMSAKHLTNRGLTNNVHAIGHSHGDRPDVTDIQYWHVGYFGKLVKKLADAREADGSRVLDHCAIAYVPEAGHGYNPESGDEYSPHSTDNMALLLAGGAGGLQPGRHVVAPEDANHPANVYISAMEAVGAPNGRKLGEVSGIIPDLFQS